MSLYKSFATVGGLTMISRVLGFARDMLIAAGLGSGPIADAFFVAFRFPNLFRRLFGEGAFNSAFVPLFAKRLEGEGPQAAKGFAEEAFSGLLTVVFAFSVIAMLAMPWLMLILAPGFVADQAKFDYAVMLTQIAFPYLLCMSLVALLSGVLNSLHRFWAAAAAPILLNVVLISTISLAMMLGYTGKTESGVFLATGVTIAGIVQLAVLWISTRRAGMRLSLRRPRWSDDMRRLWRLGVPGLVSGGITQINIVVGTIIASLQAGAVSYLYYADRLYQLPLGIVGVAIGVVLLPDIARRLRAGDEAGALDSQNRSLEFSLLLTLPAAVALAIAAEPIIRVLYERGAFTADDTRATSSALAVFALGLPAFVLIKVFQPAFFAREDTRTPMNFAFVNLFINVALSVGLFFLFRSLGMLPFLGIALGTTIAAWVNVAQLFMKLSSRGHFRGDEKLDWRLPMTLVSSVVMGGVVWLLVEFLGQHVVAGNSLLIKVAALAGIVGGGLLAYGIAVQLTRAADLRQLKNLVRRRRRSPAAEPLPAASD